MSDATALRAADADASRLGGGSLEHGTVGCSKNKQIEFVVVGEDDSPVAGVGIELQNGDRVTCARTDPAGRALSAGLDGTDYKASLFELDAAAWELVSVAKLGSSASGAAPAVWTAAAERPAAPAQHVVAQGDCISSIAAAYGYLPAQLWNDAANASLKSLRGNPNVLFEDDVVALPAKSTATIDVQVGQSHRIRRKGVPEHLRVRFLDAGGEPRTEVPYLLHEIETVSGRAVKSVAGETDGDGFLDQPIPPDATAAEVVLGDAVFRERHSLALGWVDPQATIRGVQARLNNLRYFCGDEDGVLGPLTREALLRFQHDQKLSETGQADDATAARLRELHLS